jgi:hypothetical protein
MPDQIREHSGGLLGDAVALGVLVFCGLTMPLWKAYRRVRYGEKFA